MALDDGASEWINLHQVEKILFVDGMDGTQH